MTRTQCVNWAEFNDSTLIDGLAKPTRMRLWPLLLGLIIVLLAWKR